MAKRKKKTLPKDFDALLKQGDLNALKAVFDTCDVDARGGVFKTVALAFTDCPDELAHWLIDQGADISASDRYGETPLHSRAGHWQGKIDIILELGADVNHAKGTRGNTPLHNIFGPCNIQSARTLLAHGAQVDAINNDGLTPLGRGLQRCSNTQIAAIAPIAELLLNAGASQSPEMKEYVTKIGTNFEFHRSNFNKDMLNEASDGLEKLYALFDVTPVPRRAVHDGKSPIIASAASWEERHQELWELLVPSSGAADTVQGEVIRISGKVSREIDGNGGINWDAEYKKMSKAFLISIGYGKPLSTDATAEAGTIVKALNSRNGDTRRLCELAVEWVALNPKPIKLPPPDYNR